MRVTADTNVLLRATMSDHAMQSPAAQHLLRSAELVAVPTAAMCEFAWVLSSFYKLATDQVADAIRTLTAATNVAIDRIATEAGLAVLDAGGDFADGAIASGGRALGGTTFASFDRAAVKLVGEQGFAAIDPAAQR